MKEIKITIKKTTEKMTNVNTLEQIKQTIRNALTRVSSGNR